MKFAIYVSIFGEYSDPNVMSRIAHIVEEEGWDGLFIWDHVFWNAPEILPVGDPTVLLSTIAMSTERIKFGAMVTPLARRRPWKVAKEAVALDQLSNGRLIQGTGIGGDWFSDYSAFGESVDDRTHAEMLDEGLQVINGLWSGEPFSFSGKYYNVTEARMLPRPIQQPRIPLWVAGVWPHRKPFRRAAQWDGVFPLADRGNMTPDMVREVIAYISEHRTSEEPFDVVQGDRTDGDDKGADAARAATYAEAGATWWFEHFDSDAPLDEILERAKKGPPRE